MRSTATIDELIKAYEDAKNSVIQLFSETPIEQFSKRPAPDKWSAEECIAHLVITGTGYLDQIKTALVNNSTNGNSHSTIYKPRFLPAKFINMMKPEFKMKMKAPAIFKPENKNNTTDAVPKFINMQDEFISCLQKTSFDDMSKIIIYSSVSRLLKFHLGEAYMVNEAHTRRHIEQAKRAVG